VTALTLRPDSERARSATTTRVCSRTSEEHHDPESSTAFGPDPMDSGRQPLVFDAGLRQSSACAGDIAIRIG
jgi:hypothetical protein